MKIGFLALSGIRAHDPELLALGLTLPGFVERSRQIAEQYSWAKIAAVATMKRCPRCAVDALPRARSTIMARTIRAAGAALTFTPSATPVSSAAYHVSATTSARPSVPSRGTANTSAAKSAVALARSASEKLEAMIVVRDDVANRTTGTAQAPGRHRRRANSSVTPATKSPA